MGNAKARLLPGEAAQAALREEHWQEVERAGGMLAVDEVASLPAVLRNGLLGVLRPDGLRYPRFQLVDDAVPSLPPAWLVLRDLLAPAQWPTEFLLMWTLSPNAYLDGDSPAQEILAHPDEVTSRLDYAVDRAIPWTKKAEWTGSGGR